LPATGRRNRSKNQKLRNRSHPEEYRQLRYYESSTDVY
jgi:hypothetical protein